MRTLGLQLPGAMLFDMDGTLTTPCLDFPQIKRDMGIEPHLPILEALAQMPPQQRQAAEAVLHRHEDLAAEASTLNPGCIPLLQWLNDRRIATALVTRNRRQSVQTVLQRHGLQIDVCVTREDGHFKPDPRPLFIACQRLSAEPARTWMIGDGQYDVEAGLAAGMTTVWISHGRQRFFAAEPSCTVTDLLELQALLVEWAQ